MYDIAVVGGGPAGMSAAINGRARDKSVLLITNDYRENPLCRGEQVDNYLGMPAMTGAEMMDAFHAHCVSAGIEMRQGRVLTAMSMGEHYFLTIGSDVVEAKTVILSPGVSRGKKYPGESELLGRGVSYCATCDGMLYRGKAVAVVGRSTDAVEEATFLQNLGCQVTFVAAKRPEHLPDGMSFVKAGKLEVAGKTTVTGLVVDGVTISCDGVFILRDTLAPTDVFPTLALDGSYIQVNRSMETNLPGVFAAGDCTGLPLQVSKAVGEGLIAGQRAAEFASQV